MALGANSNYTGIAAFAIEQVLKRQFSQVQATAHPMLAMINEGKSHWNKGFSVSGFKMLVPVINAGPAIATAGVAVGSAEVTAINSGTYTAGITNALTQAEYVFGHYRNNIVITDSEITLGANNARGLFLQGRTEQLMQDFKRQIATDLSNITDGTSGTKPMSVWWPAAGTLDSDTMGGIRLEATPSSSVGFWAPGRTTSVGTLTRPAIDSAYNRMRQFVIPDLMLCTVRAAGVDVYGRFISLIDPAERIVNANFEAKYGFTNVMYRGMAVVPDYDIGSTVDRLGLFCTKNWYYAGWDVPKKQEPVRIPGTDATELFYTQYVGIACDNARSIWALNTITG